VTDLQPRIGGFRQTESVEAIPFENAVTWMQEKLILSENLAGGYGGYDVTGWPSDTWILNAMWEMTDSDSTLTHDEVRRAAIARGLIEPRMIGEINFEEVGVLTGGTLGLNQSPGNGWKRLRWADLAARTNAPTSDSGVPPCHKWFEYRSWPARILPPAEGSLDLDSLGALLKILSRHSSKGDSTECSCYYSPLAGRLGKEPMVLKGTLSEVISTSLDLRFTPSNLWPDDRSWFVFTDADLWGTKVSGSFELTNDLRLAGELETSAYP
jgi:hypothetical protein